MTERTKHIPSTEIPTPDEAQELPTHKLITLLEQVLDAPGPDRRSLRRLNKDVTEVTKREEAEKAHAEFSARAEKEWRIKEVESACRSMIDRAMHLLTKSPTMMKHKHSFMYREVADESSGKKEVSITRIRGGDYGSVRFGFNPTGKEGERIDVLLTKSTQGVVFEQKRENDETWRKVADYQGEKAEDHRFKGEYLLQVLPELSQIAQVLSLAEDFATDIE